MGEIQGLDLEAGKAEEGTEAVPVRDVFIQDVGAGGMDGVALADEEGDQHCGGVLEGVEIGGVFRGFIANKGLAARKDGGGGKGFGSCRGI